MNPNKTKDLDYRRLVRAGKKAMAEEQAGAAPAGAVPASAAPVSRLKIALLSDAATQQFVPVLTALLAENGIRAQCYEGPFDAIELEVINPAAALYAFKPDLVLLINATQALRARFDEQGMAGELERLQRIWQALKNHSTARIIQCNFPLPYERPFGQLDLKLQNSFYALTQQLNAQLARAAQPERQVLLCDLEAVASYVGRRHWFDERLWNMNKTFCNPEYLPAAAQAMVDLAIAGMGRVVKCVILDLDNTLWGGVVGDVGARGVQISAHGDGEAFYRLQKYLLSLKQRGVLLAVCSKNDESNALAAFDQHPDMVLKRADFAVFVANWDNKADNIRLIRDTLEIGFDSLVFLDDNPFERNLVREFLPEVIVPELPEDPAEYVRAVSELNLFETTSFSQEDLARAELYKVEASRREAQRAFTDVTDYLKSLDMRIAVRRFVPEQLERISQLFLRSNQFNLTTQRHNEAQCAALMDDVHACLPLTATLRDRFGDHGLISIVVAWPEDGVLRISDWLMSCRVLSRGVEQYLMNKLVAMARARGLQALSGEYIASPKNAMVKDFWGQFGFTSLDGRHWRLPVADFKSQTTWIAADSIDREPT